MRPSLTERIGALKAERDAVILAHNYQVGAVQDLADYVGDSLGLARRAASVSASVIVFCGVRFMAETAALLNPEKTVLMPDADAECPMASMVGPDEVERLRREHPGAVVVCYVNSMAEVKAASDVCCTSANAVEVVSAIEPDRPVVFVPDRFLGRYVADRTGREIVTANGYCPTHACIRPEHIAGLKWAHPGAEVMVHPECRPEVTALADVVASTGGMLRHARQSEADEFIVGTEVGLLHRLRQENPGKRFLPATPAAVCPNMKRTTPEKVLWALEEMQTVVTVPAHTAERARRAIEAMLAVPAAA